MQGSYCASVKFKGKDRPGLLGVAGLQLGHWAPETRRRQSPKRDCPCTTAGHGAREPQLLQEEELKDRGGGNSEEKGKKEKKKKKPCLTGSRL